MANGLTTKQEAFVLAYIGKARFNATKAAEMAGYPTRSAYQRGHELVKNSEIAARIKAELESRAVPAQAVLDELASVAMAPWEAFIKTVTDPKTGTELPVALDLSNKVRAMEILAKAHGLLTDKIDLSGNLTATVELVGVAAEDV